MIFKVIADGAGTGAFCNFLIPILDKIDTTKAGQVTGGQFVIHPRLYSVGFLAGALFAGRYFVEVTIERFFESGGFRFGLGKNP